MSTTPSITELNDQLTSAQQRQAAAEEQLGAAVLDGKGVTTIEKNLAEAKADVARLAAALETAEGREIEAAQEAAIEAQRQARLAVYRWVSDFMQAAHPVVKAKAALAEAEANAKTIAGRCPRRTLLGQGSEKVRENGVTRRVLLEETDLDVHVTHGLPLNASGGFAAKSLASVERLDAISSRAQELIVAEERGDNIAVTGAERRAERQAQKQAQIEAAQAEARRADAEAAAEAERKQHERAGQPESAAERRERDAAEFRSSALDREMAR